MRVLKRIITDEQEELRQMDAGAATAAGAANQGVWRSMCGGTRVGAVLCCMKLVSVLAECLQR